MIKEKSMHRNLLAFTLAAMLLPGVVRANDCPTAATAKKGFMLLQADIQSEFRQHQGPIVKILNRFGGPAQAVFAYRGLIELSRMDAEAPQAIYALSDLKDVFPLKKGARHTVSFVPLKPDEPADGQWTYEFAVTGQESFTLEDCKYKVWKVRQTTKKGDTMVDDWSALYSPDLQATLAKIYEEGTADEYTVRYERIRPLQR
ncbi:hypothetical protein [Sinorhizobium fredii]|uniref:DUF3859 domain-containing protein n=1 Tax=Sinorhizobium fredii (strain HH103) TaxID=1117943 RepID=G9AIP3_SINF1|nr:hypothetical protein [Sinorhizobium fredii]CCF00925.1 hypothetical protein SFHH103_06466 [Sinorhizobium fredii HH103]